MARLLLINWRDIKNPEAGGAEVYYHEIFRRLAARGHTVTVLAHAWPGAPAGEMVEGTRVVRIGNRSLFNFAAMRWVKSNQGAHDLILEDLNKLPFFTSFYTRKPRLHLVMHLFGRHIFSEAFFPLAAYVYLNEKLISLLYRDEKFVAISESTADDLRGFVRSPVAVVEPGTDAAFFTPSASKEAVPTLLAVSRLKKYKNLQFVLECLPAIIDSVPQVRLRIAGSGDYRPKLEQLVRDLALTERVTFDGFVSEERKRELMSRAHVLVNPSAKEGWGITNIEANLCGTVSLSSNVGGLRDSVLHEKTGLLYEPGNPQDFSDKCIRLLTDVMYRKNLEDRALKVAKTYSWDTMTDKMETCIKRVLAGQNPS